MTTPTRPRDRLMIPLAIAITLMWLAAGIGALVADRVEVFVLANVPFGLVTGYVFRAYGPRRNGHNGNGGNGHA